MLIFDIAIINDTNHVNKNLNYTFRENDQYILVNSFRHYVLSRDNTLIFLEGASQRTRQSARKETIQFLSWVSV